MDLLLVGIMPENPDDPLCPVKSYVKYHGHLNPENSYLWQVPLKNVNMEHDPVWYTRGHIGKNPLAKFMTNVSKYCELSKVYTNHCIRVTGASILTRMQFSASEIMSVTGHKSVQSLAIYQKTDHKKKEEMGNVLGQAMHKKDDEIQRTTLRKQLPAPPPLQPIAAPQPRNAIEYRQQEIFNQNQQMNNAVENKENATDAVIPFNPVSILLN